MATLDYKNLKRFKMINLLHRIYRRIFGTIQYDLIYLFDRTPLKLYWWNGFSNFGDALNPIFIYMLSGKKASWINPLFYRHKNYIIIGSILSNANKYSIVWGAGFLYKESKCYQKPLKVCAVRGPLTRQKLLDSGIKCPEIYGDPALLLPLLYAPNVNKKYKLGIIPHVHDKTSEWLKRVNSSSVKILDIQNPDPMKFIDELLSCDQIASSSLHGIIVADAYKIPSLWLEFSDKVEGEGFKFYDYFLSINYLEAKPFIITDHSTVDDLLASFVNYEIDIDLLKLLAACPFKLFDSLIQKGDSQFKGNRI